MDVTVRDQALEVLDAMRPVIQADGGDGDPLDRRAADGAVEVRSLGARTPRFVPSLTLREGNERRLKSTIPGIVEVTAS